MIALTQSHQNLNELEPFEEFDEFAAMTREALRQGIQVYKIPHEAEGQDALERTFANIPTLPRPQDCLWIGAIPSPAHYQAVYTRALTKNAALLNTPDEHLEVFEFDRYYKHLEGLTPKSVVIDHIEQLPDALAVTGTPAFLKGLIFSRKNFTWGSCVANDLASATGIASSLLKDAYASRGRVAVRELVDLQHFRVDVTDFRIGREFRVFLYGGEPMGWGYYWPYIHAIGELTEQDEARMLALAREAARRIPAPYVCLDIGQLEDGDWIIIESGDPQFAGTSWIPLPKLWQNLRRVLR